MSSSIVNAVSAVLSAPAAVPAAAPPGDSASVKPTYAAVLAANPPPPQSVRKTFEFKPRSVVGVAVPPATVVVAVPPATVLCAKTNVSAADVAKKPPVNSTPFEFQKRKGKSAVPVVPAVPVDSVGSR